MFDWNDEELTNIIWGDSGECDDHIVPFPGQNEEKPLVLFGDHAKKENNQENANVDRNSMGSAASNSITKLSKDGFLRDQTPRFDNDSECFQNPEEDGEQGDFVDYDWANIGSFDDLDRIFSNNDPIFANADEPWSSSIYEKSNEIKSHSPHDIRSGMDTIEFSGGKCKLLVKEKNLEMGEKSQSYHKQLDDGNAAILNQFPDKGNRPRRSLKGQKPEENREARKLHDLWSSSSVNPFHQIHNPYAPPFMVNPGPPMVHFNGPGLLPQKSLSRPLLASPLYGNSVNFNPTMSVLSQFHPGGGDRKLASSGYEVPPSNANSLKKTVNALSMTPKEKIEKLRRRQQLRAILAIQKQQEQFGNHMPVVEHSAIEGGSIKVDENFGKTHFLDANSPDDSDTASMVLDNCSVEESVLYRLQETISKLDIRIRLSIRDSLFRLARSAAQRQDPNDTSSRDEVLSNKDIDNHERFTRMPDMETDTNQIDRTVAHLLFHRPLEILGKLSDTPESPLSANVPYEREGNSLKNEEKDRPQNHYPASMKNI